LVVQVASGLPKPIIRRKQPRATLDVRIEPILVFRNDLAFLVADSSSAAIRARHAPLMDSRVPSCHPRRMLPPDLSWIEPLVEIFGTRTGQPAGAQPAHPLQSALFDAAGLGDIQAITACLSRGADPNAIALYRLPVLVPFTYSDPGLKVLIHEAIRPIWDVAVPPTPCSPIHIAAMCNQPAAVDALLDARASVSLQLPPLNFTPLPRPHTARIKHSDAFSQAGPTPMTATHADAHPCSSLTNYFASHGHRIHPAQPRPQPDSERAWTPSAQGPGHARLPIDRNLLSLRSRWRGVASFRVAANRNCA
jgi:hypothetical protein